MSRSGMVLILVLLAVLALELLALSALTFARMAQLGARTSYLSAQLRTIADDAVEHTFARIDVSTLRAHPVGSEWETPRTPSPALVRVRLRRLAHGLVLVRVEASRAHHGRVTAAALARTIEPEALLEAFPAVLTAAVPPPPLPGVAAVEEERCESDPFVAPPLLPAFALRTAHDTLPLGPDLPLDWLAVHRVVGPDTLLGDTGSVARLVAVRGPVALADGFTGMLVVDGDLSLERSAELRGLVVVRGALRLGAGARIRGAARVGVLADEGGSLTYDRCAVAAALDAAAFRRVYRAGVRWRVPAF